MRVVRSNTAGRGPDRKWFFFFRLPSVLSWDFNFRSIVLWLEQSTIQKTKNCTCCTNTQGSAFTRILFNGKQSRLLLLLLLFVCARKMTEPGGKPDSGARGAQCVTQFSTNHAISTIPRLICCPQSSGSFGWNRVRKCFYSNEPGCQLGFGTYKYNMPGVVCLPQRFVAFMFLCRDANTSCYFEGLWSNHLQSIWWCQNKCPQ